MKETPTDCLISCVPGVAASAIDLDFKQRLILINFTAFRSLSEAPDWDYAIDVFALGRCEIRCPVGTAPRNSVTKREPVTKVRRSGQ